MKIEKQLVQLWDEFATTKTWWYPEDATLGAFIKWLKDGKPNIDISNKMKKRNAFMTYLV